jgi:hypothetical protein
LLTLLVGQQKIVSKIAWDYNPVCASCVTSPLILACCCPAQEKHTLSPAGYVGLRNLVSLECSPLVLKKIRQAFCSAAGRHVLHELPDPAVLYDSEGAPWQPTQASYVNLVSFRQFRVGLMLAEDKEQNKKESLLWQMQTLFGFLSKSNKMAYDTTDFCTSYKVCTDLISLLLLLSDSSID